MIQLYLYKKYKNGQNSSVLVTLGVIGLKGNVGGSRVLALFLFSDPVAGSELFSVCQIYHSILIVYMLFSV